MGRKRNGGDALEPERHRRARVQVSSKWQESFSRLHGYSMSSQPKQNLFGRKTIRRCIRYASGLRIIWPPLALI